MAATVLTLTEAAECYRLGKATLRDAIRAGKLRASKHGRMWRLLPRDVELWLFNNQPTADDPRGIDRELAAIDAQLNR